MFRIKALAVVVITLSAVGVSLASGQSGGSDLAEVKEQVRVLRAEVTALKTELAALRKEVAELRKAQIGADATKPASKPDRSKIIGRWEVETAGQTGKRPVWVFASDGTFSTLPETGKGTFECEKAGLVIKLPKNRLAFKVEMMTADTVVLRTLFDNTTVTLARVK